MVRSAVFITLVSGGTTEEMIAPSRSCSLWRCRWRMWWKSIAYSTSVLSGSVRIWQTKRRFSAS